MRKIDKLDLSIIRLLQEDGRRAYSEIASQLNVSEGTVRSRINRMLEDGVFEFVIHTNPLKVGLEVQAIIGLSTRLGTQEHVAMCLGQYPEVRFIGAFSGKHDLIIQAYFRSNEDLVNFVNRALSKIDGIISADVSLELKQYKDSFSYVTTYEEDENIQT